MNLEGIVPSNELGRRRFLAGAVAFGATSLLGPSRSAAADPPPETKRIRLVHAPAICLAPQYLAEDLLHLEGFQEVQYVETQTSDTSQDVEAGFADLSMDTAPAIISSIDKGETLLLLAGIHGGCYELFANPRVRAVRDLKGKRVAVTTFGSSEHIFISSILAYVGMNPTKDIQWILTDDPSGAMPLFVAGKADAFLAFPPEPQELRARKIGHVIVDTTQDRPWSQYFCCMVAARREFVQKNPVAAKRALRAILKATDICALEPERAAQMLKAKGYEPRIEIGLEVLRGLDYKRWRTFSPEDTLRFHALRLHEVGMIKSTPQRIIDRGTDWRFLNELKRELKA
jgi:NitT/TauT family transport system substrate-binding protein